MTAHVDVAVIGAGVTGLAAAWAAEQEGAAVAVLEASSECGGVIKSELIEGFLVERGATSMSGTPTVMAMLRKLDIESELVIPPAQSKRRFIVRDGRLSALPSSPPALITTPVLTLRGKLRALCEPLQARSSTPAELESIAQLVRRRFGDEVLDYLIDPFISGVYAGDPELLSSRFALKLLAELEQEFGSIAIGAFRRKRAQRERNDPMKRSDAAPHILSFRHGMQTLPLAINAALAVPAQPHTRVTGVRHESGMWSVSAINHGVPETLTANALVVAMPAHQVASVEWPAELADAVTRTSNIPHAPVATVALGYRREAVAHALDGFGVLVPHKEQRGLLGALFNSTMFEGRAPAGMVLLTAFVGGARFGGSLTAEDAREIARREVAVLLGASGPPDFANCRLWQQGIPQFNLGHETVDPVVTSLENSFPGIIFAGSWRTGVAVGDCLASGLEAGRAATVPGRVAPLRDYDFLAAADSHSL